MLTKLWFSTALLSALVNNTAVVASMLGAVKRNPHHSASRLLLPMCFAATFGGVLTLIGTSTNLIVNSFLEKMGRITSYNVCYTKLLRIPVLALHQSLRQVDIQFILDESHYEPAVRALHGQLIEPLNHGVAICAA